MNRIYQGKVIRVEIKNPDKNAPPDGLCLPLEQWEDKLWHLKENLPNHIRIVLGETGRNCSRRIQARLSESCSRCILEPLSLPHPKEEGNNREDGCRLAPCMPCRNGGERA